MKKAATVTNANQFSKQITDILKRRLSRHFEEAANKGYYATKRATPDTRGILKTKLSQTVEKPGDSYLTKGFSFMGLTTGEKEGLRRMEFGFQGFVDADTPEMREWIEAVIRKTPSIKEYFTNIETVPVGFNYNSAFYGGSKNPIQRGYTASKLELESSLKVKFKKI